MDFVVDDSDENEQLMRMEGTCHLVNVARDLFLYDVHTDRPSLRLWFETVLFEVQWLNSFDR